MSVDLVATPFRDTVEELVMDRRTGRSWTVPVEPFELSGTVVTRGRWNQVHGGTVDPELADLPQTVVSWRDAIQFCNALSAQDGLTPVYTISQREVPTPSQWRPHSRPEVDDWLVEWDHESDGYRLPTDAEWQLACRADTTGPRYAELDRIGWYADNSDGHPHPVRLKQPNAWGLFDMLGGVWEWCWDLYDPEVYGSLAMSTPTWPLKDGQKWTHLARDQRQMILAVSWRIVWAGAARIRSWLWMRCPAPARCTLT